MDDLINGHVMGCNKLVTNRFVTKPCPYVIIFFFFPSCQIFQTWIFALILDIGFFYAKFQLPEKGCSSNGSAFTLLIKRINTLQNPAISLCVLNIF